MTEAWAGTLRDRWLAAGLAIGAVQLPALLVWGEYPGSTLALAPLAYCLGRFQEYRGWIRGHRAGRRHGRQE